MDGWRRLAWAVVVIVGSLAAGGGSAAPALAQSQAESLSASFRKAVARVDGAVVSVRPIGTAVPLVSVPLPQVGPFRPGDWIPRATARFGELDGEPGGSGLVIDADRGVVLTNDHELRGASQAVVTLPDGHERSTSEIRRDTRLDLAILVIDPKGLGLTQAAWGDSGVIEPGDWLLAIGRPAGRASSISAGIFSASRLSMAGAPAEEWLETDALVNSVNSGGALVNLKGEVVGINTAIATRRGGLAGMGYAVPANRARRAAADLIQFGQVRRAYLGVQVDPLPPSAPDRGADGARLVIVNVSAGTPAAIAGLQPGDRILSIGGRPVAGPGMLQALVEFAPIGEELAVAIERSSERRVVTVRPQAQPGPGGLGRGAPGIRPRVDPDTPRDALRVPGASPPRIFSRPPIAPRPAQPPADQDPSALDPIPQRDRDRPL
jgi:serine protease Do